MESYFKGDKELFKGLKIDSLEKERKKYPVIYLDLDIAKGPGFSLLTLDMKEKESYLIMIL